MPSWRVRKAVTDVGAWTRSRRTDSSSLTPNSRLIRVPHDCASGPITSPNEPTDSRPADPRRAGAPGV